MPYKKDRHGKFKWCKVVSKLHLGGRSGSGWNLLPAGRPVFPSRNDDEPTPAERKRMNPTGLGRLRKKDPLPDRHDPFEDFLFEGNRFRGL